MASDPIRILIVDDDEDVLIALERLLEGEGYATITAWSARDAIVKMQKSQFRILLVDENLGDSSPSILDDLRRAQPHASFVLMQARRDRGRKPPSGQPAVCKWGHADMTGKFRSCLAA